MDELKFNKIAAAFLLAGLIIMAGYKISEILVPKTKISQNSFPIEVKEISTASISKKSKGPEPILALISEGDIQKGMKIAKKCTACHLFNKNGKNKVGPVLWNIVNSDKGKKTGFAYSKALLGMGGIWDYVSLNKFLYKPKQYIKGTKMNYAGLKKVEDRNNLIAYLRSLSDTPASFPTQEEILSETVEWFKQFVLSINIINLLFQLILKVSKL